ncbi:DUF4190 domain-containing protein [Flavobacterium sp. LM4]|uniref:DUF4190 domain-containing protein n=1 Tax=Flavobacterium sp. LM4 TaxID=1938609 RepID=UPI000992BD34|nr:DUF4190 domain-containing protein [Flavobacterium sp. LM4]OOV16309.1 hypothetical protein BXU10_22300 [Flavobacterium sp. LM4]
MEKNLQSNAGQGMGVAALILGIIGTITAFIPCFGLIAIIFGVLAIVLGAIGMSQAKKENASTTMPKAGLILGIAATVFVIIWVLIVVGTIGATAIAHKDEISDAIDSIKVEAKKIEIQDSLNTEAHIVTDTTVTVEE